MSLPRVAQPPGRGPYHRPMRGWWRRDPFFIRYMIREATALAVAAYALVLLAGLLCLARGEASWNHYLDVLRSPVSLATHLLLLVAMIYHSWSWFEIMPKTLPALYLRGRRISAVTITTLGLLAAGGATLGLLVAAWMLRP